MTQAKRWSRGLGVALALAIPPAVADGEVTLFAAASMTDAVDQAIERYEADRAVEVVTVYASSSTLARQIASGAPADLYISANVQWMDWLAAQGIALTGRRDLVRNRLALVAPENSDLEAFVPGDGTPLASLLDPGERLAVGDPDHVPAGIYARQALESLGEWQALAPRLARADNVRAALALVERGEVPLGVVYRTDAGASDGVRLLGLFPADAHPAITYPMAAIGEAASAEARALQAWLAGDEAMAIFAGFGFSPAAP